MKGDPVTIRSGEREVTIKVPLHCPISIFQSMLTGALHPLPPPYLIRAQYPTGSREILSDEDLLHACESQAVILAESTVRSADIVKVMSYNLRIFVKGEHWKRRSRMLAEIVTVR